MPEIIRVLKVVRRHNGKLLSMMPGPFDVRYEVGKNVYPEIGLLFAFRDLSSAEPFYSEASIWAEPEHLRRYGRQLWRALAEPVEHEGRCAFHPETGGLARYDLEQYWQGSWPNAVAPLGTVCCRWIRLLEPVTGENLEDGTRLAF